MLWLKKNHGTTRVGATSSSCPATGYCFGDRAALLHVLARYVRPHRLDNFRSAGAFPTLTVLLPLYHPLSAPILESVKR